jgi:hypothetical protein
LRVDRGGARARLGGEAFAGARAEGTARATFGPVQAGVEGSVGYGIGATGQADVDLTLRRVGGRVKLGVVFGVGLEGGFEYYLEPAWLADGLLDVGDGIVDVGTAGVDVGRVAVSGAVDTGAEVVGDALDAGGSAIKTVGGWLG